MRNTSRLMRIAFWLILFALVLLPFVPSLLNVFRSQPQLVNVEVTVQSAVESRLTEVALSSTPTPSPDLTATIDARVAAALTSVSTPEATITPTLTPTPTPSRSLPEEIGAWLANAVTFIFGFIFSLIGSAVGFVWSVMAGFWTELGRLGGVVLQCVCCVLPLIATAMFGFAGSN